MSVLPLIESSVMFCSKTSSSRLPAIIFALLLTLLLGLGGCSAVRIGYNNAPNLLYWWIDGYVDFDQNQSLKARATLDALHDWHRRQELPAYIALLQALQAIAPADVTPQQVCVHMASAQERLRALLARGEPGIAALVPSIKPEQIEHLSRQFSKRNESWRDKWLSGTEAERRERRVKQAADRYEDFYGKLDERQLAVIRASVVSSRFDPQLRHEETLRRQQEALQALRQLLAANGSETNAAAAVHTVLQHALSPPDPAVRARLEAVTQDNCRAIADLHNSTSAAQRRLAIAALKNYEDDFRALLPAQR